MDSDVIRGAGRTILKPTGPRSYDVCDEFGDPLGIAEAFDGLVKGRWVVQWWAHLRRSGRMTDGTRGPLTSLDEAVAAVLELVAEADAKRAADEAERDAFWARVNPEFD